MRYTDVDVIFEELSLGQNPHAYATATGVVNVDVDADGEWTWSKIMLQTGYERATDGSLGRPIYDDLDERDPLYPVLILALEREDKRTGFITDAAYDAMIGQQEYHADQHADFLRGSRAEDVR